LFRVYVGTTTGFILKLEGVQWGYGKSDIDLCMETVIKPRKNIHERTGYVTKPSPKMTKITFCTSFEYKRNISLLFSFTVCYVISCIWELPLILCYPVPPFPYYINITFTICLVVITGFELRPGIIRDTLEILYRVLTNSHQFAHQQFSACKIPHIKLSKRSANLKTDMGRCTRRSSCHAKSQKGTAETGGAALVLARSGTCSTTWKRVRLAKRVDRVNWIPPISRVGFTTSFSLRRMDEEKTCITLGVALHCFHYKYKLIVVV
jgi:hypothetical protein